MDKNGAVSWKIEGIVSKGDYFYAKVKDHPNATSWGYVLHHRVVMENHLGRLLSPNEIVHHINHDRKDNRIENLEVMTRETHGKLHARDRPRKMALLRCPWCKNEFERAFNQIFLQKGTEYTCCSATCRGKFSRVIQLQGRTTDVEMAISENLVSEYIKYSHDNPEQTH